MIDLTGRRFGTLIVLAKDFKDKHRDTHWLCQCDCGALCVKSGHSLRRGNTKTCGTQKHRENRYEICSEVAYCIMENTGNKCAVDVEDVVRIKQFRWYEDAGYAVTHHNGSRIKMHRLLLNAPQGMFVDHINHNTLDNTKANLRIVTPQQNCMNVKPRKGISGVNWCKASNKWRALINDNGKRKHLGLYEKYEDAVDVRKAAELQYYGEYRYIAADEQMEVTLWTE